MRARKPLTTVAVLTYTCARCTLTIKMGTRIRYEGPGRIYHLDRCQVVYPIALVTPAPVGGCHDESR